jgi:hypothetical protein
MKKIILGIVLAMCSFSGLKAQEISATIGPELKDTKNGYMIGFAGSDENNFYALRLNYKGISRTYLLDRYSKQLDLEVSVPLYVYGEKKIRATNMESVMLIGNKLFAISHLVTTSDKLRTYHATEIDKETLLPKGNPIELGEVTMVNDGTNKGPFSLSLSPDSTKILATYLLPYEEGSTYNYGIKIFDNTFSLLWENKFELPFRDPLYAVNNAKIDNQGSVFLSGKVFDKTEPTEKKKKDIAYQFHLFAFSQNQAEPTEYIIDSKSNFLNEFSFYLNDKNEIVCYGFYTEKLNEPLSDGTFYAKIDAKTKKVLNEKMISFYDYYVSKGEYSGKDTRKLNFKYKQLVQNPDGSSTLVAEQVFTILEFVSSSQSSAVSTVTTNYYNNIMVLKFDKEGNLIWLKTIPKGQRTGDPAGTYMSYAFFNKNNNIYLFFNEATFIQEEEIKQSGIKVYRSTEQLGFLNAYAINNDGVISYKKTLFDQAETHVLITPLHYLSISDKQLILFGRLTEINRFAEVIIE